jgi:hypothetical protein
MFWHLLTFGGVLQSSQTGYYSYNHNTTNTTQNIIQPFSILAQWGSCITHTHTDTHTNTHTLQQHVQPWSVNLYGHPLRSRLTHISSTADRAFLSVLLPKRLCVCMCVCLCVFPNVCVCLLAHPPAPHTDGLSPHSTAKSPCIPTPDSLLSLAG